MFDKHARFYIAGGIIVLTVLSALLYVRKREEMPTIPPPYEEDQKYEEPEATTTLYYTFNVDGVLDETVSMEKSTSPYFWLNSGGRLYIEGGIGRTIFGRLPGFDRWRLSYFFSNPVDTERGYRPQNIFRLVTKSTWDAVEISLRFKIDTVNLADSPNRGGWSGVQLMSRYHDGNNLYYAGIRMDGSAVIKKKHEGVYYTLAIQPEFIDRGRYDRTDNPNVLPEDTWMGIRSITTTNADGSVTVELWLDRNDADKWEKVFQATDTGEYSEPIKGPAHAGIRTDYLDLQFDDFVLKEL